MWACNRTALFMKAFPLLCQTEKLEVLLTVSVWRSFTSLQTDGQRHSQISELASRGVFVQMNSAVGRLTLIAYTFSCQASNGFPGLKGTQVTNYSLWQVKPSETLSGYLLIACTQWKGSGSLKALLNYTAVDCWMYALYVVSHPNIWYPTSDKKDTDCQIQNYTGWWVLSRIWFHPVPEDVMGKHKCCFLLFVKRLSPLLASICCFCELCIIS